MSHLKYSHTRKMKNFSKCENINKIFINRKLYWKLQTNEYISIKIKI